MTREEFENRSGKKVSSSDYEDIENVYLNLPLMDKETFCKNWRKVEFNPIVMELSDYITILIKRIADLKEQIEESKNLKYKEEIKEDLIKYIKNL